MGTHPANPNQGPPPRTSLEVISPASRGFLTRMRRVASTGLEDLRAGNAGARHGKGPPRRGKEDNYGSNVNTKRTITWEGRQRKNRSVGVLVMRDRTSKSLSRTAFPDNLLSPGRPASVTLGTQRLARLPQVTGRWQIAPIALTSGAYARRSCYRSATCRGLPAFVFTLHGRQRPKLPTVSPLGCRPGSECLVGTGPSARPKPVNT